MPSLTARAHRWIGLALAVPMLLWTGTGLLFHLKPGWDSAYEMLSPTSREPTLTVRTLVDGKAVLAALPGEQPVISQLELIDTAAGPIYRVRYRLDTHSARALVDAASGAVISPLDQGRVRVIVEDAVSRSRDRDRYGHLERVEMSDRSAVVVYSGGPRVTVGRFDAQLRQRGPDTDRIDWLYRVHYLAWTGHEGIDRALSTAGIAATWILTLAGLWLFIRRRPRPQPEA